MVVVCTKRQMALKELVRQSEYVKNRDNIQKRGNGFMKSSVVFLSIFLFMVGCTSRDSGSQKKVDFLNYGSPIKYVYKKIDNIDWAALIEDEPVSWSQLLSQDEALQELQETYYQKALVFSYLWAKEAASISEGGVDLQFFAKSPELEVEELFAKNGISLSKKINLKFGEENTTELARIGEKSVSWSDFHKSHLSHSKLYKRLFKQRMQRLNGIVIRRYLLKASRQANEGMEQFVQKNIIKVSLKPTEDDVYAFAKKRGISESDIDEKMIGRLKDIIQQEDRDRKIAKYVADKLIKKPIQVSFKNPELKIKKIEISNKFPSWGDGGDRLTFFGHWMCEGCSKGIESFLAAKTKWERKVRGKFVFLFSHYDRESRMGAEAALCVDSLDKDSFWEFLDKVIKIEDGSVEEKINLAVKKTSVDFNQFRDCFLNRKYQESVNEHLELASGSGLLQSPLFVVNTSILSSPVNISAINQELEKSGLKSQEKKSLFARLVGYFGF